MSAPSGFGRRIEASVAGVLLFAAAMVALGAGVTFELFAIRAKPSGAAPKDAAATAVHPVASIYDAAIRPLLDAKCTQCHGEQKQKAGLSLATAETILAGGKRGSPIDRSAPEKSLMLARLQLPLDEDKHMPPGDEEQLAPQELALLQRWILAGAPFEGVVEGLDGPDAVAAAGSPAAGAPAPEDAAPPAASIPPADRAALEALQGALVHAQPLSEGSPLLWVDFSAVAKSIDEAQARALLAPLREQLADVSLARCPVGDATLALLADFPHLRRIDVRSTKIGDQGLAALANHAALEELVLSQNQLGDASADALIAIPALARVHLWRSGISAAAVARLRAARPELSIDDGAEAPSAVLEQETKVVLTKAPPAPASGAAAPVLAPVNTKCPVTGAPVLPKFSVVHEGRVIGFCCSNCPKEFWADPAKFLVSLD